MKKIISYLLPLMMITIFSGCTRNNGNIGPIFGRWALQNISTSGVPEIQYDDNITWAFQSSIVQMIRSEAEAQRTVAVGSYRLDDNTLFLDFSDPVRPILPELGLPAQSQLHLLELKGSTLKLEYNPTPDTSVVYTFTKW